MAYVFVSLGRCKVCTALLVMAVVMPLLVFLYTVYTVQDFIGVRMLFNATGVEAETQPIPVALDGSVTLSSPLVRGYVNLVLLLIYLIMGFYAVLALGDGVEKGYVFLDMVAAGGRLRGLARIILYVFVVQVPALVASGFALLLVLRVYLGVTGDTSVVFWSVLRAGFAGSLAGLALTLFAGDKGIAILSLMAFTTLLVVLDNLAGLLGSEHFFTAFFSLPDATSPLAYPILLSILVLLCIVGVVRLEVRG